MKRIWILGLCLLMAVGVQAQETYRSSGKPKYSSKKKKSNEEGFKQKLIVGGELGLSFGQYTSIAVSPVAGYRITDNFSAGIVGGYQYFKFENFFTYYDQNTNTNQEADWKGHIFTVGAWARYLVWRNLFVHAEYQHNFMSFKAPANDPNGSGNVIMQTTKYQAPSVLVGPGYRLPMGDKASVNFSLLYDVVQDKYSPYGNQPFIRIQFLAGF